MVKFGIYANIEKDEALTSSKMLIEQLSKLSLNICYDECIAKALNITNYEDACNSDVLFVLGGDGTILRAAKKYICCKMNILGINLGRIGFLTEIYAKDINMAVESILQGNYHVDKRMVLNGCLITNNQEQSHLALNDIVITKNAVSRIIGLDLYINDKKAETYMGDGIIVASPTGSTAYSLSAGGPIIAPSVNCLLVTPICQHSLYSRSLVLKSTDIVKVVPHKENITAQISLDGQEEFDFASTHSIIIEKSDVKARFIRFEEVNFFSLLKCKLSLWSTD